MIIIRLDKYVSTALKISRMDARFVIKRKEIKVNNVIISKNDFLIKENDYITYKDEALVYKEYYYYMVNKPYGCVCSNNDNLNKTIFDCIGLNPNNMFIVGRLDIDTTGLVLITNDGDLTHKLTSPKKDVFKKYYCEVEHELNDPHVFDEGVVIYLSKDQPYKTKKGILEIIDKKSCYLSITEGKYHQVKKMFISIGNKITKLKRVQIGNLVLDENCLYRELTEEEINSLKNIT